MFKVFYNVEEELVGEVVKRREVSGDIKAVRAVVEGGVAELVVEFPSGHFASSHR